MKQAGDKLTSNFFQSTTVCRSMTCNYQAGFFFQNFFKTRFSNTTEKIVCVTVITTEPGHAIEYFESPQIRIQSLPVPQECANEETTRQSELIAGSNNSD